VLCVLATACAATRAAAQSAADRGNGIRIDGRSSEFTAAEAAFRTPEICAALVPPIVCSGDEEPAGDSAGSMLHDVRQIHVTWDADSLYVAVDATLGGQAIWLGLDWMPGGLESAADLSSWRRALRFGSNFQPDAFLVVSDAQAVPELYFANGPVAALRIGADRYAAAASFDADAPGRALEAALPWTLLFPNAPVAVDPEPGAPARPMFVLPLVSSRQGLRLAAVVIDAAEGRGGDDVAPDNVGGVPLDPRTPLDVDRAVRVDWDAQNPGAPHFVDFGAALQTQLMARFVPGDLAAPAGLHLENLRTFAGVTPTRLVLADAGQDVTFTFDVGTPTPDAIFVSATIVSLRGERIRELYRDARRSAATRPPPFAPFGDPAADRWDGRDAGGQLVTGGIYVLRVAAGLAPGTASVEARRAVTVVR
jgi:hypothetical protein